AAGAPPARMMPAAAPLAELLRALAPPLEYLAADDFRRLDQTRLPLPALAERVARARESGPPGAAGPLAELERILAALREGSARDQERLLRRAHGLLPTRPAGPRGRAARRRRAPPPRLVPPDPVLQPAPPRGAAAGRARPGRAAARRRAQAHHPPGDGDPRRRRGPGHAAAHRARLREA